MRLNVRDNRDAQDREKRLLSEEAVDYWEYYDIMRVTRVGIQFIILVATPRFGGKNVKLMASPCIPSSSRAFKCDRPGNIEFSSIVPRVDVEPWLVLVLLDLMLSCSATRKIFETDRMMDGFDEFANVSLMRSCSVS